MQMPCFELDQPEVHKLKKGGLEKLDIGEHRSRLHLIAVDFKTESVRKVSEHPAFKTGARSLVLMEGVSQYIPEKSTAETLGHIQALVGPGSILGMSYVDEATFDENLVVERGISPDPAAISRMLKTVCESGEPWVSGWSKSGFASFLEERSFRVVEDLTIEDLEVRARTHPRAHAQMHAHQRAIPKKPLDTLDGPVATHVQRPERQT